MSQPETSTTHAKALFETLDALMEALNHVDYQGEAGHVTDLDEARAVAEVMLQALDGDYGYVLSWR